MLLSSSKFGRVIFLTDLFIIVTRIMWIDGQLHKRTNNSRWWYLVTTLWIKKPKVKNRISKFLCFEWNIIQVKNVHLVIWLRFSDVHWYRYTSMLIRQEAGITWANDGNIWHHMPSMRESNANKYVSDSISKQEFHYALHWRIMFRLIFIYEMNTNQNYHLPV